MVENLPASNGGSGVFEWIANIKVPGAVKAINRVIGVTAEAGADWIEVASVKAKQVQQGIKDDTAAKSTIAKALAKAAAQHAANDPERVERALEAWAGERFRSQINRENVAAKTIEHLTDGGDLNPETDPPSDDWLNIFGPYAERASSEKLQDTWARLLAGEIRRPGTFSFRTLHLVSILDESLASMINKYSQKVFFERFIPINDQLSGDKLDELSALDDVSFLRYSMLSTTIKCNENGIVYIRMGRKFIEARGQANVGIRQPVAILSQTGKELMKVINPQPTFQDIKELADALKSNGIGAVRVGDVSKDGEKFLIGTLIDL